MIDRAFTLLMPGFWWASQAAFPGPEPGGQLSSCTDGTLVVLPRVSPVCRGSSAS